MKIFKYVRTAARIKAVGVLTVLVLMLSAAPAFSANITVPELEIYTWGRNQGSGFELATFGDIDLLLDGGYKFGGSLLFGFSNEVLETASYNDMLAFKAARITLRELFNIPLNFTYFIGEGDTLGSGDIFSQQFGTAPVASAYPSYVHFPNNADVDFFSGIHTIYGTGGEIEFAPIEKNWLLSLYIYQDASEAFTSGVAPNVLLDYGHASMDIRAAFSWETIKMEAFLGATYPTSDSTLGYYRSGLLLYAGIKDVEFLAAAGFPLWKPTVDPFTFDLFYLLIEQRVRLGLLSEVLTVLWRPSYYHQTANTTRGIDINLDMNISGSDTSVLAGGIEGNFVYQLTPTDEITAKLIPYLQVATSGVVYEVRASTKIWPFDADFSDFLEVFLSIKASF